VLALSQTEKTPQREGDAAAPLIPYEPSTRANNQEQTWASATTDKIHRCRRITDELSGFLISLFNKMDEIDAQQQAAREHTEQMMQAKLDEQTAMAEEMQQTIDTLRQTVLKLQAERKVCLEELKEVEHQLQLANRSNQIRHQRGSNCNIYDHSTESLKIERKNLKISSQALKRRIEQMEKTIRYSREEHDRHFAKLELKKQSIAIDDEALSLYPVVPAPVEVEAPPGD